MAYDKTHDAQRQTSATNPDLRKRFCSECYKPVFYLQQITYQRICSRTFNEVALCCKKPFRIWSAVFLIKIVEKRTLAVLFDLSGYSRVSHILLFVYREIDGKRITKVFNHE